jgi:hypothetical protein
MYKFGKRVQVQINESTEELLNPEAHGVYLYCFILMN